MNAANCLEWCKTYAKEGFPDDKQTARHVLEFMAKSACTQVNCIEDAMAVQAARKWAKALFV